MEAKQCFIGTILFLGLLVGVRSQQPCSLGVKPAAAVLQVPQKANLSLECNASCLGPLSRGQLTWTDPRGAVVPSVPGRLFTVNYNQWTTNRLILLDVTNEDSGVYKCEINHKGLHLQRFTIIRVEETATAVRDPGPRRGDISVKSDLVFPEVRAVRDVSREAKVKYPSRAVKGASSAEPNGYFYAALYPSGLSMGDDLDTEDLAVEPKDASNSAWKRSKRSSVPENDDSSLGSGANAQDNSLEENDSSFSPSPTTTDKLNQPSSDDNSNSMSSNSTAEGGLTIHETTKSIENTTLAAFQSQDSSSQPSSTTSASQSTTGITHRSSSSSSSPIAAGAGGATKTDSMFGTHGVLAFSITLAVAVLLLYALLLVILVPRCCGKRQKQATLDGDAMTSPGEENVALMEKKHKKVEPMTSATGLNGEFITAVDLDAPDENDGGQKNKDDGAEKKDDKEAEKEKKDDKEGDIEKKEDKEETPESFVSTFLLGRLSSSKPEEGADSTGVPGGEDDVFSGLSGTGGDVKQTPSQSMPGDSTPAKEPQPSGSQEDGKKEEKLELNKSSPPPDENKTEIKFENEIKDSSGREAAGKDEGSESHPVQAPDGVQQQVSDIRVGVSENGNIQDIPLLV